MPATVQLALVNRLQCKATRSAVQVLDLVSFKRLFQYQPCLRIDSSLDANLQLGLGNEEMSVGYTCNQPP